MLHQPGRSEVVTLAVEPVVRLKSSWALLEQLFGSLPRVLRLASIVLRPFHYWSGKPQFRPCEVHSTSPLRRGENHEERDRTHRCRRPETSSKGRRSLPNFSCYRVAH